MNVSLTPQLEAMVRERVASGRYSNASEVVRDALRQMEEREQRLAELRAALTIAEAQVAHGQVVEWTPDLHAEIMRGARAAAEAGERPKPDVCP